MASLLALVAAVVIAGTPVVQEPASVNMPGVAEFADPSMPIDEATAWVEVKHGLRPVDTIVLLDCSIPCPQADARLVLRGHRRVEITDTSHPRGVAHFLSSSEPPAPAALFVGPLGRQGAGYRLDLWVITGDYTEGYQFTQAPLGSRSFWLPPLPFKRGCFGFEPPAEDQRP